MKFDTKPLLIKNGHIIDPSQKLDEVANLLVVDGKIEWIGKQDIKPPSADYEVIPADGMIVCPGFIDLHCHLRQPGNEEKETIATGTRSAAKGGFTTVCCMPNTNPPLDNKEIIDYVKSIALNEGSIQVLPVGCLTIGRRGQALVNMSELVSAGVVAFSDDGSPVMNENIMISALKNSTNLGIPIIDHCENTGMSSGWDMNGGKIARKLRLRGMPANSEESMIKRDIEINQNIGGRLHIAHVSTAGSVEIIRKAKEMGCNVTAECTPSHLTLTEEKVLGYDTDAKVNPPLRTKKDIGALIDGLNDNTIDILATDHAPHTEDDKICAFSDAAFGISSFETAFGSLMSLVHSGKLPLNVLVAKLTGGPARILGNKFDNLGALLVGTSANITIFDPEKSWVVNTYDFISKGKNTPLAGETLKSKVMVTLYQGKVVYQDETIKIARKVKDE